MKTPALILLLALAAPATAAPLRAVEITLFEGVCAITSTGTIVCEREQSLPDADMLARDLVLGYDPIVVREDGSVVRVPQTAFDEKAKLEPIAVSFKVRRAGVIGSAKSRQLCVVGEKGELACGPYDHTTTKIALTRVAGTFVDVTFADNVVWAIDDRGALWCAGSGNCARAYAAAKKAANKSLLGLASSWPSATDTPRDAPPWRITDGVKRVYGGGAPCIERTSDSKTLVCWGFLNGPTVYPRPKADELASVGALMCARIKDSITCSMFGSKLYKPFTVTVKDAVKMHSGGTSFCVETKADLQCTRLENPRPPFEAVKWEPRKHKKK